MGIISAVSQNLMHSNISITDGVYGILSENDVNEQIATLGNPIASTDKNDIEEIKIITRQIAINLGIQTSK